MSSKHLKLDKRLAKDCIQLGYLHWINEENEPPSPASILLLMNNADIPWFVIVPMGVTAIDIDELDEKYQQEILKEVNALSSFFKKHYSVDKINFASIGNIVKQMHFHLVVRTEQDSCWPSVVWGVTAKTKYTQQQVEDLTKLLAEEIKFFEEK
ncbi:hypothetical protein MNBD_GAMMA23-2209 [hydrothermal vent metagenome]|uniref:HIT domain-containing protein n=1 Tax=hydrothermal vent metagenome TaxID=652676 RepID=A0A3B1A263_9ZZZZ